ncbi:helix-turn-helix domain-containing protein [Shouchella shacheensis]|uniref:helix-turn-helix domain-containing protein n=1 Tax=Shouchella shacheensis TaxID=1649580 RepID=UPI0007403C63|nr:helix-turn-helix transcriptional regulator [Shouchella shacheensis]
MGKRVEVKLKQLMNERELSLRELSRLTDIRHAALSELSTHKRQNINFHHIEKIAETFDIDDIREIIDIVEVRE